MMNLAVWAGRHGVSRVTACRWLNAGLWAVPRRKVGHLILVDEGETGDARLQRAVYARVSSADQKAGLDRQVARVTAWATSQQIPLDEVVVDSAEVDDDLVRDMTIVASRCARWYGKRAAANGAKRVVEAAAGTHPVAA